MLNTDWYWSKGLHDAVVLDVKNCDLQYDYTQRNPLRNYLEINLDSKGALMDDTVKAIRLYNYKILSGDCDLCGWWWFDDKLCEENGRFILTVNLKFRKNQEKQLKIVFEKAEVLRDKA